MTVRELSEQLGLAVLHIKEEETPITEPYCCDLLSIAMGTAPAGCAWCTVMSNMNTLAVASLADAACVILCSGVRADDALKQKAAVQGINLLSTDQAIFPTALAIWQKIHG